MSNNTRVNREEPIANKLATLECRVTDLENENARLHRIIARAIDQLDAATNGKTAMDSVDVETVAVIGINLNGARYGSFNAQEGLGR